MSSESTTRTRVVSRASDTTRKQRDGTEFTGAFGQRTGDSDLLFVEGQLPERDGTVESEDSASKQLERCLENLESVLTQHGRTAENVLQVTLYLADMDAYEQVNETYEQYFEETYPARTTVGVCDLLGGAAVTVDAVVAVE
ncbi:RidA family protein [Halorussus aquaticus]|uniref:RidA family protein n=1 Tax=Halorussus aquaticus TaxID=2953748 RepID=A0ABD5Q8E6_9EURY|nr:RidA family protein [Halorussus aquaticus]